VTAPPGPLGPPGLDDDEEDDDSILVTFTRPAARPVAAPPIAALPVAAPPVAAPPPALARDGGGSVDIDLEDEEHTVASGPAPRKEDSGLLFIAKPSSSSSSSSSAPAAPRDGSLFDLPASKPAASVAAAPRPAASAPPPADTTAPLEPSALLPADEDSGVIVTPSPASKPPASSPPPSTPPAAGAASSVPVGEFEPAGEGREVRRKLPEGMTRNRASEIVVSEGRGDPTMIESSHLRSDETELREARNASVSDTGIAATLRHAPSLPRRRGVWGDLRYVFTVWLGTRRARRELRKLDQVQLEREKTRRHHLLTIGRAAATSAELDQTQIRRTRGSLQAVDQDRSAQAAQVASSDAEAETVRRTRAAKAIAHREEIEALELEQEQLGQKLEPMQRESAAARRRATDLRTALARLDSRVADVEAGRGKWADSASQAAELAALRAERVGISRDEPTIAAQLDALVPRIASIEASRERLRRKVVELNEEEEDDHKRTEELLSAIAAKRKVVERATADAEKARERMLADLGERLYVDRPKNLSAHLAPIDSIDLELGDGQRRVMELREILTSVDRWKLVRGILLWTTILVAIGGGVWFYLQGQLPFLPRG
jgi:hypothetical protein